MSFITLGTQKRVESKYGVIKTSIIKYVTPTMLFILVICGVLIFINYEQLYVNYVTNIPLNSVIIIIFLMAMIEAFNNNLNVFNTARFFKGVEKQINEPVVSEQSIIKLKKMLDTGAYLINTQNTFKLLVNLQKYGHPLITDKDAMLIKSKLGFRIRNQRGSVSFMGGILVMLGLMGTFWGLLLTIGSVSDAMDVIAEQANNLGSADGEGIGGIIQSISAPLQGMGLAFSSSLFGLAGSLVVGFFNHACSQAQDRAIEDFSRWIDENIPMVGSEEEKFLKLEQGIEDKQENVKESSDEEKSKKIDFQDIVRSPEFLNEDVTTQILYTLNQSALAQNALSDNFEKLLASQTSIQKLLAVQNEQSSKLYEATSKTNNSMDSFHELLTSQNKQMLQLNESSSKTNSNMAALSEYAKKDVETSLDIQLSSAKIAQQNEQINAHLAKEHQSQEKLLSEVYQIRGKIPQSEYEMLRKACMSIANNINSMDQSLKDNAAIMQEVVKEGNLKRMSRILKEMQSFWLQMKENAFDVVSKDSTKK